MKWKIGIWGQYGAPGQKIADGQAVRTTVITKELENRYGKENIGIANTNGWRKRPIAFLWESFRLIANSPVVVIAPADKGYKTFVPILMFINRIYHRKLVHIVIGGYLPALLEQNPRYLSYEKRFDSVFVQTENIKTDIEKLHVGNIHFLSNLKRLKKRNVEELRVETSENIKVCVFSRINKDKGIEDAIEAVKIVNKSLGAQRVTLELYGLLPDAYKERFNQLLKENKGLINYRGIVDYNKTVEVLSDYFVMLFPTYYHGEGFPGNVVDAYNAALPIIATDWLYNKDIIRDGRNGILVPIQSPQAIADALLYLYDHREIALEYARNCLEDAVQYEPDKVLADFYRTVEGYWKSKGDEIAEGKNE
jgi:glycosyltransferase involved in cell wall biosynthesis